MNKKWFTFIELLVVITIIWLLGSWWAIHFSKQIESLKLSNELKEIEGILTELDIKIQKREILDYAIDFSLPAHEKGFIYNTNRKWAKILQDASFDSQNKSITFATNSIDVWKQYSIDMYSGIKFQNSFVYDVTENQTKDIWEKKSYIFHSSFSWSIMNDVGIHYYSNENVINTWKSELLLTEMNTKIDKSWVSYNHLSIIHDWKRKKIIWNSTTDLIGVYIFFETESGQGNIHIQNY